MIAEFRMYDPGLKFTLLSRYRNVNKNGEKLGRGQNL